MNRFTIGRCRSGRTITSHTDLDGLESFEEIFDAMAALSNLAVHERRVEKESDLTIHLAKETRKLEKKLHSAGQWQIQMNIINAKTALDIRNYAVNLLRPEFKK